MMDPNPRHTAGQYTYKTSWSKPDQKFVGTCLELPGLSHLDADEVIAARGIYDLTRFVVHDMINNGEAPPAPTTCEVTESR